MACPPPAHPEDNVSRDSIRAMRRVLLQAIEESGYVMASLHWLTSLTMPAAQECGLTDESGGEIVRELHELLLTRLQNAKAAHHRDRN